ncbi:MAG: 1-deoxy-D-xylulose-5-phosphate reductoisomerase [Oscillospiraceae bacterium]|nr:1-deoxy-D-xylulose-5-phosphate reductoisomerase [Oscillospiraceae bacterium]
MKTVTIIGSTGSIGKQALEVCKKHNIKVLGLAAHSNVTLLAEQVTEFSPEYVCIYDDTQYNQLKELLQCRDVKLLCGMEGLCFLASLDGADLFVNSVVGMVGLLPTLTAIEKGVDIALANKEALVAGGELVMAEARKKNVQVIPIDSEHSAIFQCLRGNHKKQVSKLILTASGGAFFGKTKKELASVTVEQALKHPNWSMGGKITVDSATLMNKGLEFIEALQLFGYDYNITPADIEIIINRESVLHSAVEFDDYSVIAQLGVPDMKIPIQYALLYPERLNCEVKRLSLTDYKTLSFYQPDYETFDCLTACIAAAKTGFSAPCAVNAANEEAVKLFLNGKIPFLKIGELVTSALNLPLLPITSYEDVIKADKAARNLVRANCKL